MLVTSKLKELQAGNTHHSCFLCQWRCRDKNQYDIEDWQMRNEYRVGEQNINAIRLVNRSNILIPPLHIKLIQSNMAFQKDGGAL